MAVRPLRLLMIASEAQPFSKTGGLADVATALSLALGDLGHHVTLMTPRYRGQAAGVHCDRLRTVLANQVIEADLFEVALGDRVRVLLLDCPPLFDRDGIYAAHHVDFPDNALRFAFLSQAAVDWAGRQPDPPALLHAHDWQAGLVPVYARGRWPVVFTIHNLAFQGVFDKGWVPALGLRWDDFTVAGFEFWDRLSYLKAGVMFSDALTTVSPTYAEEIQRPEYGYGFDGIMRARRAALTGILNGIDTREWDPAADRFLPQPFSRDDLSGKRAAKRALLELYNLPADDVALARPIVAMISRMREQKGLDLIAANAHRLPMLDATFTVTGTGDPAFESMWRGLAAAHPQRVGVHVGYDEPRAHLVAAGADLLLMPSRYEPCGLTQMYSMRYGTVPVVRAVGGLVDTVTPHESRRQGTGFLFADYHPEALWDTLQKALALYRAAPAQWQRLQVNGMRKDFSWKKSAAAYVSLYRRAIAQRRAAPTTRPRVAGR